MVLSIVAQAEDVGRVKGACAWQRINGERYPRIVTTKFASTAGGAARLTCFVAGLLGYRTNTQRTEGVLKDVTYQGPLLDRPVEGDHPQRIGSGQSAQLLSDWCTACERGRRFERGR